jgi:hypothetical protein
METLETTAVIEKPILFSAPMIRAILDGHVWDNMRFDEQWKFCWDSINGHRPGCSWTDNPFCWCISFRSIKP